MRKAIVVFGLGLLLFGLSLGQVSSAQMQMGAQPSDMLPHEIHLLKVINQAGLTKTQLNQFQGLLSGLREAQQAIVQRQQELKTFLLAWQGMPKEFSAALQPFENQVHQANQTLKQEQQSITSKLKNLLSYYQGETLFDGLRQMTASSSQMSMSMDMQSMMQMHQQMMGSNGMQSVVDMQQLPNDQMGPPEMTENGDHQAHHPEQNRSTQVNQPRMMENSDMQTGMQSMMQIHQQMMGQANWGALLSQHLDLLEQVIPEKAANL